MCIYKTLAILLALNLIALGKGNDFNVRYNGGSIPSEVKPHDWGNKLTITPEAIILELKDNVRAEIPSNSVTSLSYGQEAHRRVGTMIALTVLVAPLALFGLLHKTRVHFIGLQSTCLPDRGPPRAAALKGWRLLRLRLFKG